MNVMVADAVQALVSPFAERYDNVIGGKWVAPVNGRYFDNVSPITGKVVCAYTVMTKCVQYSLQIMLDLSVNSRKNL